MYVNLIDGFGDGISGIGGLGGGQILLELFSARADDSADLTHLHTGKHTYIHTVHTNIYNFIRKQQFRVYVYKHDTTIHTYIDTLYSG